MRFDNNGLVDSQLHWTASETNIYNIVHFMLLNQPQAYMVLWL